MNRRTLLKGSVAFAAVSAATAWWWPRRWKYIVIHHSAGNFGSVELLQKVHRERQPYDPIDAIPYHYIIGNGNGMSDGEIASDWREEYDLWGAHVSPNNLDHNARGIGICLIGNLDKAPSTEQQYRSLVQLTKRLMQQHSIAVADVSGHGLVDGEATRCPGEYFSMLRFLLDIA